MDFYFELGDDGFRLLEIDSYDEASNTLSCSLKHCSLSDHPPFDAISYTCADLIDSHNTPELIYTGPEKQVVPQITLGSHPIEVGTNLSAGLYRMHILGHKVVWADAICINQVDQTERGHQVALMRRIYSQAASTATWLGRAILVTDDAMDAIEFVRLDESTVNVRLFAVMNGELNMDEQEI